MAGLGEKKIQLSLDADALCIYSELCSHFPKLTNAGGFELLKVQSGGKLLAPIQVPANGYSAVFLKSVVHNAKIYLRPVQQDLSLDSSESIHSAEVSLNVSYSVILAYLYHSFNLRC